MNTSEKKKRRLARLGRFLYLKLVRINDSPHRIAAGFGIGVFLGVLPGLGVLTSILVAALFRVNRAAALAGSLVTNGWITLFTLMLALKTGAWITGTRWQEQYAAVKALYSQAKSLVMQKRYTDAVHEVADPALLQTFFPMLLGYFLISLMLGIIAYSIAITVINRYRAFRLRRRQG